MKVLIADRTHEVLPQRLREAGIEVSVEPDHDYESLVQASQGFEGLVVRSKVNIDSAFIDRVPSLRCIGRVGAGMETIDVDYAEAHGVRCLNSPEGNRDAVGEHAVGLLLALLNNIARADAEVRRGLWQREANRGYELGPLTVGIIAFVLKRWKGWRYVFEVRDLWPEFPIQVGAVKNPIAIKLLRWLERFIYRNAEHIVALSPGMKAGVIKAGTPEGKVSMIPNMSKPDKFFPHEPNQKIARIFRLDLTKFNVIHFGAMGQANGLRYIIEAARILKQKGDETIRFVFLGGGATESILKSMASDYGL